MYRFSQGDRVVVLRKGLKTTGEVGTVVSVYGAYHDSYVEVRLDCGYYSTYKDNALGMFDSKSAVETHDSDGLAAYFLYFHDHDENPRSLKEAKEKFRLEEPDAVVFDLKEAIEAAHDSVGYENGFILVNNKVYPITKTVSVPGLETI